MTLYVNYGNSLQHLKTIEQQNEKVLFTIKSQFLQEKEREREGTHMRPAPDSWGERFEIEIRPTQKSAAKKITGDKMTLEMATIKTA